MSESLVTRLRKRAEIRRQIQTRKSVQEGKPDRIADLLEEAANAIRAARADTFEEAAKVCETRKKWFDEQRKNHPERVESHEELRYAGHEAGVCAIEFHRLAEKERGS